MLALGILAFFPLDAKCRLIIFCLDTLLVLHLLDVDCSLSLHGFCGKFFSDCH